MSATLLALALIAGQAPGADDEESARRSYRLGAERREDAQSARPHFARAASEYETLWDRGSRSPELAQSRARAEFLAGHLPEAIAAAHAGLRLAPHHAGLQRDLETYRDAVALPPGERLRPARIAGVRARLSEWDLLDLTAIGLGLVGLGAAKRFTAGSVWATPVAIAGALGLIVCAALAGKRALEERADLASPIWILRSDEPLRKGNGDSHPARLESALPRGAEVRELSARGGWVQVQLAGGAIGWLPEDRLIPVR